MTNDQPMELVFDPRIWGGKDKGHNEHCWQPGELSNFSGFGINRTADVRWSDGTVTRGHYLSAMRPLDVSLASRGDA